MEEIKKYLRTNSIKYDNEELERYLEFLETKKVFDKPFDNHHILMKSMFGEISDKPWNLVKLRPRDHFTAHEILINVFKERIEPVYALNILLNLGEGRTGISNLDYEYGRVALNERMKSQMSKVGKNINYIEKRTDSRFKNGGYIVSDETKLKMSKSHKGKILSDETKLKMSKSHKGVKKTTSHKEKIRQSLKGHKVSEETKKKISEKMIGRFTKNKNPSAKKIIIFDKSGNIVRVCLGDFYNYCRENKLPSGKLRNTLNGGVVEYEQVKEKDKHF
jgi:hypothetical protein